ncbi:MAG TPA: competence protein TfoX, partial [Candidatus Scatomorpha intestinigallinarum]|nr:competence protein TfoX [Candidatus Scatomorpha intestinigallinarum]
FPELPLAPPYAGAKDYIRVEDTDDAAALCALARLTCEALAELPQPKRRKRNAP